MMKYLVAYYTLTGNTEFVAGKLAEILGALPERIQTVKPIKIQDLRGFHLSNILLVQSIISHKKARIEKPVQNAQDFDRIIIATPVWMNNPPPAVNSYIDGQNFRSKEVAVIATTLGGGSAHNTFSVINSGIARRGGKVIAMHEIKLDGLGDEDIIEAVGQIAKGLG